MVCTCPRPTRRSRGTELDCWRALDYAGPGERAILRKFVDDIPASEFPYAVPGDLHGRESSATRATSTARAAITPLRWLEPGLGLLELSNGPTLAFKDMAMQLLGGVVRVRAGEQHGERLNVLGATSGDTGSAAEYALRGRRGINVFMLSPNGRMSEFQRAQMFSLTDANIFNLAIEGVFDDCQDLVKQLAGDSRIQAALQHRQRSTRSIGRGSWRRSSTTSRGTWPRRQSSNEKVSFAVPSGNFGNILSGWVAKQMGLPIDRLVLATNENDVLDEFFRTGRYRVRSSGETHATSSPSMDISKASNFERFIFDLVEPRPRAVARALVGSRYARRVSSGRHADLAAGGRERARVRSQHACRPHSHHSHDVSSGTAS